MNTKIVISILLCLLMVGIATADSAYDASVTLENKNTTWVVLDNGVSATIQYNESGEEFEYSLEATGLEPETDYSLIYYADETGNWGGANPGALIGDFTTNESGDIPYSEALIDLDMNLPCDPDININPDDSFCDGANGYDYYDQCCGAKLWLIPSDYYNVTYKNVTVWKPDTFLFETDLIWYDDTDINEEPYNKGTSYNSEVIAGEEIIMNITVCDEDGLHDLETMIVTANFSEYGVTDSVVFTMVECEDCDCICREYKGTVIITETGYVNTEITAMDSSGNYTYELINFEVIPGPCSYMKFHNNHDYHGEEELITVALTQLSNCDTKDYPKWWSHSDKFDIYMIRYNIHLYDKYDNHIDCIDNAGCCTGFDTETSGVDASIKYDEGEHSRIIMINDNNPGETTVTVNCLNNDVPSISQTVKFLNPIDSLDITSTFDEVYTGSYNNEDAYNISAQLLDVLGDPIPMPGVSVKLYIDNIPFGDEETNENGIVTFDGNFTPPEEGLVTFRCWSECKGGLIMLDVIESVLMTVEIDELEHPVEIGQLPADLTYTCYNQRGNVMASPDCVTVWSCDDLGVMDNETFTALDIGISEITVDVCGVIGTGIVTVYGVNGCPEFNASEEFTSFVGTISVAGNFTEDGNVCLSGYGDPIESWTNDTRGAFVAATENVTLDLAGEGDTWKQNGTEWEFYTTGSVSIVKFGTYALINDPVIPDPTSDPDPTPRKRSSGGGGLYPVDMNKPADNTTTTNNTTQVVADPEPTTEPTKDLPTRPGTVSIVTDDGEKTVTVTVDEDGNILPGFSVIMTVLGLISVAYIVNRRRD